jgi:hypothetical protein
MIRSDIFTSVILIKIATPYISRSTIPSTGRSEEGQLASTTGASLDMDST